MQAAFSSNVPPTERLVLLALADAANDAGRCWPSVLTLCSKTGLSERTVQRCLAELESLGWLNRGLRDGHSSMYVVCNPRQDDTPVTLTPPSGWHPTPVTLTPHPRQPDTHNRNRTQKNPKEAFAQTSFAQFWSAYPKKRSKGQAEKAWSSLKPNEQLIADILEAIQRAKTSEQWRREGGAYIPYPATWLRAKGWEDEITPAKPESSRDSLSWLTSDRATEAKGRELGMTPRPGEDWEQYRTRIRAQLRRQEAENV